MVRLKQEIREYVAKKREFQELEERVLGEIREAFIQEIPILSAKLPRRYGEYMAGLFEVRPPVKTHEGVTRKKPWVFIPVLGYTTYDPQNKERPSPSSQEIKRFNNLLSANYKSFESRYGAVVLGFLWDKDGDL